MGPSVVGVLRAVQCTRAQGAIRVKSQSEAPSYPSQITAYSRAHLFDTRMAEMLALRACGA